MVMSGNVSWCVYGCCAGSDLVLCFVSFDDKTGQTNGLIQKSPDRLDLVITARQQNLDLRIPFPHVGRAGNRRDAALDTAAQPDINAPVSYTHLTLPTSDLV